MSLVREQAAFMSDLRKLLNYAEDNRFFVTGGELERRPEVQALYLKNGCASTMDSMHLRRCAINLYFFREEADDLRLVQNREELLKLGEFWESLDPRNRWCGKSNKLVDTPCFERDLGAWPSRVVAILVPPPPEAIRPAIAPAGGDRDGAVVLQESASASQLTTLRRGTDQHSGVSRLQQLLVLLNLLPRTSGEFDSETERAVVDFQCKFGLVVDGIVGEKTWTTLLAQTQPEQNAVANQWLSDKDLEDAANEAEVPLPAMKAVYEVESNGVGFIGRQPKVLFEGHVFWKRLEKAGLHPVELQRGNQDILYPKWTKIHYVGGSGEHQRLKRAQAIHSDAALESASWGLFQIMGYHWKALGYDSANHFANKMAENEREQLLAFIRYLKINKTGGRTLAQILSTKMWPDFARAYNGPGYRKNRYDDKLREAFSRYAT
ncbi:MAG: N-acetylmuramidase domain-containing protein [Desulfobulbus sp.]